MRLLSPPPLSYLRFPPASASSYASGPAPFPSCLRPAPCALRRSSSASNLRKSFLHTGSWYKMSVAAGMGSRQSSLMERLGSSAYSLRDGSISAVLCTLIVALGPIQFGFTCGYSSPTQDAIISHLGIARFCSWVGCWKDLESV